MSNLSPIFIATLLGIWMTACAQRPPDGSDPRSMSAPPATAVTPGDANAADRVTPPAVPRTGSSRQDDCRGPAELCKQDSAR